MGLPCLTLVRLDAAWFRAPAQEFLAYESRPLNGVAGANLQAEKQSRSGVGLRRRRIVVEEG